MKNLSHLTVRAQYDWTDQKMEVHGLIWFIAFLLTMVLYKRAKEGAHFKGSPHRLLEMLSAARLGTFVETPLGNPKAVMKLPILCEEMDEDIQQIPHGLELLEASLNIKIPFSVYN
jgi:hypothetical protein